MAIKTKFELKTGMATREAFGKALVEAGRANPNVVAEMKRIIREGRIESAVKEWNF